MSVIFNSVTQYVEQVGRIISQSKFGDLDTLETIFTGPTVLELQNTPAWGAKHPAYPFMSCESATITRKEAGISEIKARYIGKIRSQTSVILTTPVISSAWHEQNISWTTYTGSFTKIITPATYTQYIPGFATPSNPGGGMSQLITAAVTAPAYVLVSYAMRYTTKGVTYTYITNVRPDVNNDAFNGTFAGPATNYLGFKNEETMATGSSVTMDFAQAITTTLVALPQLSDFQITDLNNGWFQVTETYMKRWALQTSVPGH
jgi:hypothetical protein